MAKLYFRYGAMNCGKSTALIQVDYNYRERGMRTLIIKPRTDSKGSDRVISRLEVERLADVLATEEDDLYTLVRRWCSEKEIVDCVLVDEAQFLKSEQVDQLFKVAVIADIPVICYGLRTDFLLNGFEGSARLLLLAHSIEELKTICRCGQKAMANGRMVNGRFVFEGRPGGHRRGGQCGVRSPVPGVLLQTPQGEGVGEWERAGEQLKGKTDE
jgi:thymidine kinase